MSVVAVKNLSKHFGGVAAVTDLSFTVDAGQVVGLLGPNGAGKTTSLRMLMGLIAPSSGSTELFGTVVRPSGPEFRRVGAMVEQAAFIPHLSGLANLRIWWTSGGAPMSEADLDTALAVADLGDAIHRKVRTYSQGMKQRLGFARLLLARPELLVLDEPTNGLDPGEIREIRNLIHRVADGGATVLLSSHHLPEVEQTCSHVVVMDKGRLMAEGTVAEVVGQSGSVYVEVDDVDRGRQVLAALEQVADVETQGDGLHVQLKAGNRSDLVLALVGAGLKVETVMAQQRLEDAFLGMIEHQS